MKRIIISIWLLLGVIANSLAQQINASPSITREAYMKKSRSQKQGSVLLVVAGITIGVVGSFISAVGSAGAGPHEPPFPIVPVTIGVGCLAGGVALSKASKRNKLRALDASAHFNLQSVSSYQFTTLGRPHIPAFTFKLSLN